MPAYQLIERAMLVPHRVNGIEPYQNEIGILDLLRDLSDDDFPYPQFHELRVVGLEEVLYAARPDEAALAIEIRRRLKAAASDFERRMVSVQVVFQEGLMHGDTLWAEYRGQRLPIGHIFGSPTLESDAQGNRLCRAHYALT
jgi:hypothetical protein